MEKEYNMQLTSEQMRRLEWAAGQPGTTFDDTMYEIMKENESTTRDS